MKKRFKRIIGGIIGFVGLIIFGLVIYNIFMAVRYKSPVDAPALSGSELEQAAFVKTLREEAGDKIWPGFDTAGMPIMLYNDQYEFILDLDTGDATMEAGEQVMVDGEKIYRREAGNPQAFAVKINNQWAGSLGVRKQMNREMFNGLRREMPYVAGRIFPFFLVSVSEEMHISGMIHELFHAYQAKLNESKFLDADGSHRYLENYPYGDPKFSGYWNTEGRLLMNAIYAGTEEEAVAFADSFLMMRQERRMNADLRDDQVMTEKKLEWLEGTAKYAEAISYQLAVGLDPDPYSYKENNAYWEMERKQRLPKLGETGGDNRFYHSGAAQAFILDRLSPGWKESAMADAVYLEDQLEKAIRP